MGAYFDIALSTLVVIGAAVFLLRRFRVPKPPSCAPDAKSQPQVILGSRLAKALETQRLGQR